MRHDPVGPGQRSLTNAADEDSHISLQVSFNGDSCWVKCPDGEPFGCLTSKATQKLRKIAESSCIEIDAITSSLALKKARLGWKKSGNSATLQVELNIYGHAHYAKACAQTLSTARLFLQPPSADLRSLVYDNPQYLKLSGVSDIRIPTLFETDTANDQDNLSAESSVSEVEAILDHLPQLNFLKEVPTDGRVITALAKHQKEAVDFITRREDDDLPPGLSLWKLNVSQAGLFCYRHVITGAKSARMEDALGGILADDMGLGKTLSMLAVVVASLGSALNFAIKSTSGAPSSWQNLVPSKATLVVVPSALLLDSWTEEIQKHIAPGTLTVYRYHGFGKRLHISALLQCDIVLTTYATIAAEFCRGQSTLDHVEWYRIVLDEAHSIRNSSTKQFRAIRALSSRIRWCLTGTPIQNKVEDLGALLKFIRVPILDEIPTFRKYVTNPVAAGSPGRFANLRKVLASLCLRRTKALLNLPDPVTDNQLLGLSKTETESYREFAEICKRAIDLAVSGHSPKKVNQHIIEALLRMRLFCNHGISALTGKWNLNGFPSDPEEALSYLQTKGKATCVQCDSDVLSMYQDEDRSSGCLTVCNHLICGECIPAFKADLADAVHDGYAICPVCGHKGDQESFIIEPNRSFNTREKEQKSYSTKLCALLRTVGSQSSDDKCVVFSFWKKTLDVVAEMFEANGILFHRIHGSLAASQRSKILSDYAENPSIRVILITFGTGAVGINKLVVANKIHIIEPQWNPSIESQAIGRILRLGQERTVTIIRYIMKETVEESVQSQQLRKLQLARGGFGVGKDEHTSQRVQEIMEMLCPSTKRA